MTENPTQAFTDKPPLEKATETMENYHLYEHRLPRRWDVQSVLAAIGEACRGVVGEGPHLTPRPPLLSQDKEREGEAAARPGAGARAGGQASATERERR